MGDFVLCSKCFRDEGLRLDSEAIGAEGESACPNCGSSGGRKLDVDRAVMLAHRFFVWGTVQRCDFGAAPLIIFNEHQRTNINISPWFEADIRLFEEILGIGFFYYGPRLWMIGEVEPLKALQDPASRANVI